MKTAVHPSTEQETLTSLGILTVYLVRYRLNRWQRDLLADHAVHTGSVGRQRTFVHLFATVGTLDALS